jgi:hypothetical protein
MVNTIETMDLPKEHAATRSHTMCNYHQFHVRTSADKARSF